MNFQITHYLSHSSSLEDYEWDKNEETCSSQSSDNSGENSIQSERDFQYEVNDIGHSKQLITLESIGYPAGFFRPQPESYSLKDKEWEIRDEAGACSRLGKFAEAAGLCIKLFVNSLNKPEDTKLLNSVVYNLLNKPCMGTTDFNFNEIQVIIDSCKNAEFNDKTERYNNDSLCTHLISKMTPLVQTIVNVTQRARLLLKLSADEKSDLAKLPPDVLRMIAKEYSNIIVDICKMHVDISRAQLFPTNNRKSSSNA